MPTSASSPYSPDAALLEKFLVPSRTAPSLGPLFPSEGRSRDLDTVLDRVERSLPAIAATAGQPAVLLSQLLSLDLPGRADAIDERRAFRSPLFLRYVRDTALSALPQQPALAEELAFVALQQAEACPDVEEARRHLLAAYCFLAAARRLRRLPSQADALLSRASFLLGVADEQVPFLRTLALLRWEQGRPLEAHLLLSKAVQVPKKGKKPPRIETALCQVALCLLHLLEGVAVDRLVLRLRTACATLDPAHQTVPYLFGRLGLACASALAGDVETASSERGQAQELFSLVTDNLVSAFACWLDARVSVFLDPGNAVDRLLFARRELLQHELPLAATLATVDAVYHRAASNQHCLIPPLLAEAPLPLELPPAVYLCRDLTEPPAGSAPRQAKHVAFLRQEYLRLPSLLRRICLLRGIAIEPLPFI